MKSNALPAECVILGSGRSILNLSGAEREYLNGHSCTLAMNKFLLFHEKAGVIPRFGFLADWHFPAARVFVEMVRLARKIPRRPVIFAHRRYKDLFEIRWQIQSLRRQFSERKRVYAEHGYWMPWSLGTSGVRFFHSEPERNDRPLFWANALDEELFFFRGSLTTAINLATVAFPSIRTIKLIGVDLNTNESFFHEELGQRPELTDTVYGEQQKRSPLHLTAVPMHSFPPIQTMLPAIVELLANRGIALVCCNPDSLLCREKICDYRQLVRSF